MSSRIELIGICGVLVIALAADSIKTEDCAAGTICKHLKNCPFIQQNFRLISIKPYCNLQQNGTYVCCPKPKNQQYVQSKDTHIKAVKECMSYEQFNRRCDLPLIVGGLQAEPKEFPFMSLLYYKEKTNQTITWLCGGSLISNRYVLTAAHCFFDTIIPNWVRLGELDYSSTTDDAFLQDIIIEDYIIHPKYFTSDIQSKYNDIALTKLKTQAIFNDYVAPICLPIADGLEFTQFWAAGWGRIKDTDLKMSTHLRKVKLDRFDHEQCKQIYSFTEELERGIIGRTQICAGSMNDSRDTCHGDSGGPLFVYHPDFKCQFLLLGITSFGKSGCGTKGYPSVYTRIKHYLDWIEHIVWDMPAIFTPNFSN